MMRYWTGERSCCRQMPVGVGMTAWRKLGGEVKEEERFEIGGKRWRWTG